MANFYYQPSLSNSSLTQYKSYLEERRYSTELHLALNAISNFYESEITEINEAAKTKPSNDPKGKRAREMYQAAQIVAGSLLDGLKVIQHFIGNLEKPVSTCDIGILSRLLPILDQRLALPLDQTRAKRILDDDLMILYGGQSQEEERIALLQIALKKYADAESNDGMLQQAMREFEKGLQSHAGENDYILLMRLGMIHLYAPQQLNLTRAQVCFIRCAEAVLEEDNPARKRLLCSLADYGSEGMMKEQDQLKKEIAAEAYFAAGLASYIDQNYREAQDAFQKAWMLKALPEAGYMLAKSILFSGGSTAQADTIHMLEAVIRSENIFALKLSIDEELYQKSLMLPILNNLRDTSLIGLKEDIALARSTMIPNSQVIAVLDTVQKKLGTQSYFEIIEAKKEFNLGRNWKILPTTFDLKYRIVGHSLKVNSTIFSPDSKSIASASWKIIISSAQNGEELQTLMGHSVKEYVYSLAFSTNGDLLASASTDRTIILWDAKKGKERATLVGHKQSINNAAFSPSGILLASGSTDATIILWNAETGELIDRFKEHDESVNCVAFNHDGTLLASCSDDKTIILWDVVRRKKVKTLEGHSHVVESVAFSPDSKLIVSAGWDKTVRLWDVSSGTMIREMKGHISGVSNVMFNHDGQTISSVSYNRRTQISVIKLWDTETGAELQSFAGNFYQVTFSPDGNTLALSTAERDIKVFGATPIPILEFIPIERSIREQVEKQRLLDGQQSGDDTTQDQMRRRDSIWIGFGDRRRQ